MSGREEYQRFVGTDRGDEMHEVVIVDAEGQQVGRRRFAHTGAALAQLVDWVLEVAGTADQVAVALESPRGPLAEAFLAASITSFSTNPKTLDRFRDRYSVAGAKDDGRDAFVAAQALRTDRDCFSRIVPSEQEHSELRELTRLRRRLTKHLRGLANQLRTQLLDYWPELLQWCAGADERWLWSLLRRAPEPAQARRLRRTTLAKLLREHRIRRLGADELYQTLRQKPVPISEGVVRVRRYEVQLLIEQLELVRQQLTDLERRIADRLDDLIEADKAQRGPHHRGDAEVLLSFPGVGVLVASTLLGEAPHQLRDYQALRCLAGVAPVTKSSGKTRYVLRRYACNSGLQDAMQHWARTATNLDPHLRRRYRAMRRRGLGHRRAYRQIGDRLLRMLTAAIRDGSLYDSRRHNQEARAA